jgi:hypothetical protein
VLYGLSSSQRDLVKCVGGLSRSLLRQATAQLMIQQRTLESESNSLESISSSSNGSGVEGGGGSTGPVISSTLMAALSSSLHVLLDALPFICRPLPPSSGCKSTSINSSGDHKTTNTAAARNDFESAKNKSESKTNTPQSNKLIHCFGGLDAVAVITEIIFGLSEVK